MDFPEFLIKKYPLYGEVDYNNIHVTLERIMQDHEDWITEETKNSIKQTEEKDAEYLKSLNSEEGAE